MSEKITLISFALCPYVQRAVIMLNEKGVAFERINIDLANKPEWFLQISPQGKVPVLKVGAGQGRPWVEGSRSSRASARLAAKMLAFCGNTIA